MYTPQSFRVPRPWLRVRPVRFVGPALFVLGFAALVVAFLENQATLSLFIIFPIVTATGGWAILGILLIIVGFFLFFIAWPAGMISVPPPAPESGPAPSTTAAQAPSPAQVPQPQRRWGGVVFLGPVPVVFGSDQKVTRWMLVLGLILFVALAVFTIIALRGI